MSSEVRGKEGTKSEKFSLSSPLSELRDIREFRKFLHTFTLTFVKSLELSSTEHSLGTVCKNVT